MFILFTPNSILPGNPTAPPEAFSLLCKFIHALIQCFYDLPLYTQKRGKHIPLCTPLLWLNFLQDTQNQILACLKRPVTSSPFQKKNRYKLLNSSWAFKFNAVYILKTQASFNLKLSDPMVINCQICRMVRYTYPKLLELSFSETPNRLSARSGHQPCNPFGRLTIILLGCSEQKEPQILHDREPQKTFPVEVWVRQGSLCTYPLPRLISWRNIQKVHIRK